MEERWQFFLILGLIVISGYILWPFADAIMFGFVTAYGIEFLMGKLDRFVDNKAMEWGLLGFFFAIIGLGLYVFISNLGFMVSELVNVLSRLVNQLGPWLNSFAGIDVAGFLSSYIGSIQTYVSSQAFSFASRIPLMLLEILVYFLVVYFVYRDKDAIEKDAKRVIDKLPDEESQIAESIVKSIGNLLKNIFAVYGILGLLMGAISAIGYYFLGLVFLGYPLPFFWFWALMTALAAFLRGVASGIFLGPITAYYFVIGEFWFAFSLGAFSIIFLWIIPETFILPYLGAKRIKESYIIMILGFLAGPLVFGFKGIMLGPIFIITLKNMIVDYFYS